ncbi:MAG: hypothetical protein LBC09_02860 [Helicobacteraceae bacterium]|jgi:alpha-tubulin suppressor-like RCC1 family protein|nr:hypothetical protein [Helicobacteraceae bacterium]
MRLTLLDRLALPRGLKAVANAVILSLIVSAPLIGYAGEIKIQAIVAGSDHSFVVSKDGKVYATNFGCQFGWGYSGDDSYSFTNAISLNGKNIIAISSGLTDYWRSLALSKDGKVYAAGDNNYGQLGLRDSDGEAYSCVFAEVKSLSGQKIIAIAANADKFSLVLTSDGKVYGAGDKEYDWLGLGDDGLNGFAEIKSLSGKNIVAIATGFGDSFVIAKDGKVYAMGNNNRGQLGVGDDDYRRGYSEIASLSAKNIIAIDAKMWHSLALAKNGRVYAAGDNEYGQLGLGDSGKGTNRDTFTEVTSLKGKNIIAIATGNSHSLALSKDGKVYATGGNWVGQLGLGDSGDGTDRNTFSEVTSLNGKKIIAIDAGDSYSLALAKNGRVYATGYNYYGQLGLGGDTNRNVFTLVPIK